MTDRLLVNPFGTKAIVVAAIVLTLFVGAASVALAQAAPEAPAPAAGAAAAPAEAEPLEPAVPVPLYANPLWLALFIVSVCVWLYATSWASNDARGVGLSFPLVTVLMLSAGFVGVPFTLLVHAAFGFLTLGLVMICFAIYIVQRNKVVPEQHKYLGPHHRAELFNKIPVLNKISGLKPTVRLSGISLELTNEEGRSLQGLSAEQPSLAQAAGVLADVILRAGATASRSVRFQPSGDQYVAQFLMDGARHNVEAFQAELSQQILGCVSQFVGLSKQGRMRQGSSRVYAELPGQGKVDIGVQIASAEGKPTLTLSFPNWTAHIHRSGLAALGMHDAFIKRLKVAMEQKTGAVIFCGAPATGKTTTLYAAVGALDIFTTDVAALEKQQEYELAQVRRWTIPDDRPFTEFFHTILREGPHVIMFGEIETPEHAQDLLSFAAQEGLVLSTLKSQDAPGGLLRLAKLADDPELVPGSVTCMAGQQLVRKLCTHCREEAEPNPQLLRKLQINPAQPGTWYRPVGCDACLNSGYQGRIGIFSMLIMIDPVKDALRKPDVSPAAIRQAAGKSAFRTMYQDGISKVTAGVTTLEEVRRVLKRQ